MDIMLSSDGRKANEVLAELPYDEARSPNPGSIPDSKRYRDNRQLFRTVGLLYDEGKGENRVLKVTALGRAVARWRPVINERNALVLGGHAVHALAACQLRNPTRDGGAYSADVTVFPFSFIWRAMLALNFRISSDELNRAVLKAHNETDLAHAIATIAKARETGDLSAMGGETVTEVAQNDRILVWMAWASFGWTLITDKRTSPSGHYEIPVRNRLLLQEAASVRHRHREFGSEREYVEHISACAGIPEDIR